MARRKTESPSGDAILALLDGEGRLAVKVTPGARGEALEIAGNVLCAKVRAKPQNGAANEAVLALIADALDLARSRVTLLRGTASREKVVRVDQS